MPSLQGSRELELDMSLEQKKGQHLDCRRAGRQAKTSVNASSWTSREFTVESHCDFEARAGVGGAEQ